MDVKSIFYTVIAIIGAMLWWVVIPGLVVYLLLAFVYGWKPFNDEEEESEEEEDETDRRDRI